MSSLNHNKAYSMNPIITVSHQNNDEEEHNENNLESTNSGEPIEEDCYYTDAHQIDENHKNGSLEGHNTNTELDEDENMNHDQSDLNEDDAENFDDDYDEYNSMTLAKNDNSIELRKNSLFF